jgi:ABC-type polar amino acid transport system ATPase subunit
MFTREQIERKGCDLCNGRSQKIMGHLHLIQTTFHIFPHQEVTDNLILNHQHDRKLQNSMSEKTHTTRNVFIDASLSSQ